MSKDNFGKQAAQTSGKQASEVFKTSEVLNGESNA